MTTKTEKQPALEGLEMAGTMSGKGTGDKNATKCPKATIPIKGLMVGRNWRVAVIDSMNLGVYRRLSSKDSGKERWEIQGYFGTLAGTLHYLIEREIKATDLKDLQTVVDKVEQLKHDISGVLNASGNGGV